MRRITITVLTFLAACGPALDDVGLPARAPASTALDPEPDLESTGLGGSDVGEESTGDAEEYGTGGGSGGSEGGESSSSGGMEGAGCTLPGADTACWAIVEAAETIDCERVGGSCWAVVAAQYIFGDASLAQRTAACEDDCDGLEESCSFVPGAWPPEAMCLMATEADCLGNAAAAGIQLDDSVAQTCARLATAF